MHPDKGVPRPTRRSSPLANERGVSEHLHAERPERSEGPRGYRNGTEPRGLGTRVGKVELRVRRTRIEQGNRPALRWAAIPVVLLLTLGQGAFAQVYAGSPMLVKRVLVAADTVLFGEVIAVKPLGERQYSSLNQTFSLPTFEADFRVELVIKGEEVQKEAKVEFFSSDRPRFFPFESLTVGEHCIVFLKKPAQGNFQFASESKSKILVSATLPADLPAGPPEQVIEKILIGSLNDPDRKVVLSCMPPLVEIGGDASRDPLWKLAQKKDLNDEAIRGEALAFLLYLQYKPALGEALKFLKEPTLSAEGQGAKMFMLSAIGQLRNPELAPEVQPLLASEDARVRLLAAMALRGMRAKSSVPYLVGALDDKDSEVRYQAMMGLAAALNRRGGGWTANADVFAQNEDQYISKWKEWWKTEGMKEFMPPQPPPPATPSSAAPELKELPKPEPGGPEKAAQ